MGGETEKEISSWTVDSLHAHLDASIREMDRRYEQRFKAQQDAVNAAMAAAEKAVVKAEMASEKRFDAVNEFRGQLSDQASTFMPRREAEARANVNAEKIDKLDGHLDESLTRIHSRLDRIEARSAGLNASWIMFGQVVAVFAAFVGIVLSLSR